MLNIFMMERLQIQPLAFEPFKIRVRLCLGAVDICVTQVLRGPSPVVGVEILEKWYKLHLRLQCSSKITRLQFTGRWTVQPTTFASFNVAMMNFRSRLKHCKFS